MSYLLLMTFLINGFRALQLEWKNFVDHKRGTILKHKPDSLTTHECILVSQWTFQPTLVFHIPSIANTLNIPCESKKFSRIVLWVLWIFSVCLNILSIFWAFRNKCQQITVTCSPNYLKMRSALITSVNVFAEYDSRLILADLNSEFLLLLRWLHG